MKVQNTNVVHGLPLAVLVAIIVLSLNLSGCKVAEAEKKLVDDVFKIEYPAPVEEPGPLSPLCYNDRFQQPDAEISKKVDILFITDTSGSLDQERAEIADGIDAFVAELPADVDYQVAVLQGHGSRGSGHGKLHKYKNDPHVLASKQLSLSDIRKHLKTKLMNVTGDNFSDGGEEGLYSLSRALDTGLYTSNRAHGFFRDDAGLAIVFIADENDICARYPAGVTPVRDPDGQEPKAFERDCLGITPESVLLQLKARKKDMPLVISGIIYTNPASVPQGGENEVGYGYIEMIEQANGISIDMATGQYRSGLSQIGALTTIKLNLKSEFKISKSGIDTTTIEVRLDGTKIPFQFNGSTNEVLITELGFAKSTVDVSYCLPTNDDNDQVPPDPQPPGDGNPPGNGGGANPGGGTPPPGGGTTPPPYVGPYPPTDRDQDGDGLDDQTGVEIY